MGLSHRCKSGVVRRTHDHREGLLNKLLLWRVRWYEIAISFLHCPFLKNCIVIYVKNTALHNCRNPCVTNLSMRSQRKKRIIKKGTSYKIQTDLRVFRSDILTSISRRAKSAAGKQFKLMYDLNAPIFYVVFNAVVFIGHNRAIMSPPTESVTKNFTMVRTRVYVKKQRG